MYFADFETTTNKVDTTKSWVWMWGIKGTLEGDELSYGANIEGFLDHCAINKKKEILFHNLAWDFNYIYKFLLDKKDFKFIDETDERVDILNDKEWTWLCDNTGRVYSARVMWRGVELHFYDSWLVLMASVGKLGASIGLEKLGDTFDYDHYHDTVDEWCDVDREYLERDIDIVIETFMKSTSVVDRKMTRAGMAYEHFRRFYGEREFANDFGGSVYNYKTRSLEYWNILRENEWNLVTRSYQGGYTNWNKNYTDKVLDVPNGVSYDVNSLYPAVMENNKMPYGRMLYTPPKDSSYVTLLVVHINNATLKDPKYPPLFKAKGKSIDAKYLDEIKYEERVMWEEEFNFIKQYYDIDYSIYSKRYFKTKYVFNEWLSVLKENKIKATDPTIRDFWKGIYNSLYGKFGQHKTSGSRVIIEDGKELYEYKGEKYVKEIGKDVIWWNDKLIYKDSVVDKDGKTKYKGVAKLSNKIRYGKDKQYKHDAKYTTTEKLKYMPIASYTTWKARETLWKGMFGNLDIWLYSDTDSCYYSDEPVGIDIHESRFGAWKAEHKFDKFKVLRAKCYMYHSLAEWKNGAWREEDKLIKKISGVSDIGKSKIDWNNFYLGSIIEGGKRGTKNTDGGKFIIDSDYKLGEKITTTDVKTETWENSTLNRLKTQLQKEMEVLNV